MIFTLDQPVLWNGEACKVAMVRGGMIQLERDRDGFTIITSVEKLVEHQPETERLPRVSLLGGLK